MKGRFFFFLLICHLPSVEGLSPFKKSLNYLSGVVFPRPEQLKVQTQTHLKFSDIPDFSWATEFEALKLKQKNYKGLDLESEDLFYQLGMFLKSQNKGKNQDKAKASIMKFSQTSRLEDLPQEFWEDFKKVQSKKSYFDQQGELGQDQYKRYRFNYYNCKDPQNSDPEVKKRFLTFTAAMSATMGGLSYLTANGDNKEKDPNYYHKAGYEFSFDLATSLLYASNFAGPMANPYLSFAKGIGIDQASTISDLYLWDLAFGQGTQEKKQAFQKLLNHPQRDQEIERLKQYIDNPTFADAFSWEEKKKELDWDNLSDPEVQQRLRKLIDRDQYEQNKGHVIQTGNHSLDRWAFYTSNSLLYLYLLERLTNTIYSNICVATGTSYSQMKGAYLSSAGWFTLWYTSYQMIIYHFRDFMINQ